MTNDYIHCQQDFQDKYSLLYTLTLTDIINKGQKSSGYIFNQIRYIDDVYLEENVVQS